MRVTLLHVTGRRRSPTRTTYTLSEHGIRLLAEAQGMLGITRARLAAECGVKPSVITDLLNGKHAAFRNLPRLCELLEVPLYAVLRGVDPQDAYVMDLFRRFRATVGEDAAEAELRSLERQIAGSRAGDGEPSRPTSPHARS